MRKINGVLKNEEGIWRIKRNEEINLLGNNK